MRSPSDSDGGAPPFALPNDMVRSLLELGMTRIRAGTRFGNYRLVKELGRGGMGVVFEATARHLGHSVALKLMSQGDLASRAEVRRFQIESENTSRLRHPNIVQVLHVGRCRGHWYFTMPIMRGGSLARAMAEWTLPGAERPSFVAHARLLAQVARGVHHAHEHGLLHRDIKPGNILLDERQNPLIADFGLARVIGEGESREADAGAGTLVYMSPEQVSLGARHLTVSADVYSLGAVLYELLTGKVPFFDAEPEALRRRIVGPEPVLPPRSLEPAIPRDLESVCLKALEKDRADRYPSAAVFADDLESIALGLPPSIEPLSSGRRIWHWVRRNPRLSARIAWSVGLVAALVVALGSWWQAGAREQRTALDTNAFIASGQAGAALFQLREYADRLQTGANEPVMAALAQAPEVVLDPPPVFKKLSEGLDSVFLLSTSGFVRAQWPLPPVDIWQRVYEFRDYFRGARSLGERGEHAVYVARAFVSERDGGLKFGVSTPLFENGKWVGVLTGIVSADSVFGKVRMQEFGEHARTAALLGPRDLERGQPDSLRDQERYVFLIHDKLHRGQAVAAPNLPSLRAAFHEAKGPGSQFSLRYASPQLDPDYHDPLASFDGSFNAAFAPVGGTGYVIVVQTPADTWAERVLGFWQRLRSR